METLYNTYLIHCLSSVHVGDGSSSGTIDLPIQREKVTGFPVFRDSSLRGSIREYFEKNIKEKNGTKKTSSKPKNDLFDATFGSWDSGDKNSALEVFPARLLFFPVRSFNGLFAYVTCPFVLQRFQDDMKKFEKEANLIEASEIAISLDQNQIMAATKLQIGNTKKVGLEEFLFDVYVNSSFQKVMDTFATHSGIDRLKTHWAVVNDTVFSYLVELFTEKVTRNRIDLETGVAKYRNLFNEEFLPEETVLYTALGFGNEFPKNKSEMDNIESLNEADKIQKYVSTHLKSANLTIGGDQSIGKGMIGLKEIEIKAK